MDVLDVLSNQSYNDLEQSLKAQFNVAVYSRCMSHDALIDQRVWGAAVGNNKDALLLGVDVDKNDPRAGQLPTEFTLDNGCKMPVMYEFSGVPSPY